MEAGANVNIPCGHSPIYLCFSAHRPHHPAPVRRRIGFILLRAGADIDHLYRRGGRYRYFGSIGTNGCQADGFSPQDYTFLEGVKNAGGYAAFEHARIEEAVLARLMDRGEKLPQELIDVVVEFLELPRWRPAPAPKKEE